MSPAISLWDAIETWLAGQEIDRNAVMLGVDITWWSRFAKLAQLIGGATVLLDILGPDRVKKLGKFMFERDHWVFLSIALVGVPIAFLLPRILPLREGPIHDALGDVGVIFAVSMTVTLGGIFLWNRLSDGLLSDKFARPVRVAGIAILAVGFSLDMLTS